MKQCAISDLEPGMVLAQPIHAYYGSKRTLLLGGRASLSPAIINKLNSLGYSYVYIEEEGTEDVIPEDALSDETRDKAFLSITTYYEQVNTTIREMNRQGGKKIDVLEAENLHLQLPKSSTLREAVKDIIEDVFLIGSDIGYHAISGISRTNAIHNHVLNVAVLSMVVGAEFGYVDDEQKILAMGALLHDVGKALLPGIYEKRYWELDPTEHTVMRHHPLLGEKLLREARTISEAERQVILQHHERQDGSGHPHGLRGDNTKPVRTQYTKANHIFRFAEIVAAADMFDNLVSGNYFEQRFTPEEALGELYREAGIGLNSEVVRALADLVTLYPVGSNVTVKKHPDDNFIGAKGVVLKSERSDSNEVEVIILNDKNGTRIPAQRESLPIFSDERFKLQVSV